MFSKTKKNDVAALNASAVKKTVPSVISSDLHIMGNLISEGHVDIDGSIKGNVKAANVTVRPNGRVNGDITAEAIHVYGEVHGLMRAHHIHLYSSCHVEGVIMHQSLTVEDGAFIDGKFKRLQGDSSTLGDMIEDSADDNDGIIEEKPIMTAGNLRLIG